MVLGVEQLAFHTRISSRMVAPAGALAAGCARKSAGTYGARHARLGCGTATMAASVIDLALDCGQLP
jgi:hypothetical protein